MSFNWRGRGFGGGFGNKGVTNTQVINIPVGTLVIDVHDGHGVFEVKQVKRNNTNQVTMVGRRYDHHVLSGDQYFVVVSDCVFSSPDLRHAYYYDGLAFRA